MSLHTESLPISTETVTAPKYENFDSMRWLARIGDLARKSLDVDLSGVEEIPNLRFVTTLQPSLNPSFPLARVWNRGNSEAGEVWYLTNFGWIKTVTEYPKQDDSASQAIRKQFASFNSEQYSMLETEVRDIVNSVEGMAELKSTGFLDLSQGAPSSGRDTFVEDIVREFFATTQFLAEIRPDLFDAYEQDYTSILTEFTFETGESNRRQDVEAFRVETDAILREFDDQLNIIAEPAMSVRRLGSKDTRCVVAIPQYEIDSSDPNGTPAILQKTHYYWTEGDQIIRYTEPEARPIQKILDEKFMQPSIDLIKDYLDNPSADLATEEISVAERQYLLSYLESMAYTADVYRDLQQFLLTGQKNPAQQKKWRFNNKEAAIELRLIKADKQNPNSLSYGLCTFDVIHGTKANKPNLTWAYAMAHHPNGDNTNTLNVITAYFDREAHCIILEHSTNVLPTSQVEAATATLMDHVSHTSLYALIKSRLPEDPNLSGKLVKFHAVTTGPVAWRHVKKSLADRQNSLRKPKRKR